MSSQTQHPRLLLIDGTCALYRSFYAIRNLSTRSGQPTNALFGFVRLVEQLRDRWQPTHWRVVFDGGSPERRLTLLPGYKAQRPPMPDALRTQGPLCEEFLDCRRIDWVRLPRQEADDVLATLAVAAAGDGVETLLATSDKDLYQLVSERIALVRLTGEPERIGPAEVEIKTGVRPDQVVDWLALVGDAVDNIPGVPGVGTKTAADLLRMYGSLEGLWARVEEVARPRIREALKSGQQAVERNVGLVRLDTAVAGLQDWRTSVVREGDADRLAGFFGKVEFESMVRKIRQPDLFG